MFQSHHRRRHRSCRRRHCTGWMKVSIATAAAMHVLLSHLRTTRSLHQTSMIYLLPVTSSRQNQIHRRSGNSSASQIRGAIGGGTSPQQQQYGQTQSQAPVGILLIDYMLLLWRGPCCEAALLHPTNNAYERNASGRGWQREQRKSCAYP